MRRFTAALLALACALVFVSSLSAQVNAAGKVTMLRVHDLGTAYGPPTDRIDAEVVIWLDSQPGKAFGFQLRNDSNLPARQGMLALLQDAFYRGWNVNIDYMAQPGKSNSILIRTWLFKP